MTYYGSSSNDDIMKRQQQQQEGKQQQQQETIPLSGNNTTDFINYANHLYDRTKIKTGDVPLFTDQFAPVENLLNPITSTPYNIGEKEIPTNRKVDLYSIQGTTIGLVLPVVIAGLWIFYMKRTIWKGTREGIAG
jgi:hypothetical protein